jgi:hypothetical protein
MQNIILWFLCLAYVIWRTWKTVPSIRLDPPYNVKSFLFTGMMWVGLLGSAVRYFQLQ